MQSKYIKPEGVVYQKIEVSGLDLLYGFMYSDIVLFIDKTFDAARLEGALQKTLQQIPVLGGKLCFEDGRLLIDTDGPGVFLCYEQADKPAPPHGDEVFPLVGHDFFNEVPDIMNSSVVDRPLMTVKVTTFADGVISLGIRHSHVLGDAASSIAVLMSWDQNLRGTSSYQPDFSRQALVACAKEYGNACVPSEKSGIEYQDGAPVLRPPQFFATQFASIALPSAQYEALEACAKAMVPAVSINHLIQALVFKTYGQSSPQPDAEQAIANLSYDLRRIKSFGLPANFFGNAIIIRALKLRYGELRKMNLLELARLFKAFSEPDSASIARDVAFYQSEYQAGLYSRHGIYTRFSSILSNGGFYINITLRRANQQFNFGGATLAGGLAVKQPFGICMAMVETIRDGDLAIRLVLENEQVTAFRKIWADLIEQVLQNGLR